MYKLITYLVLIFLSAGSAVAQKWKEIYHVPIDSGSVWTADQNQQLYIFQKQSLSKWDKAGKKMLEQSIKEIGDITSIDANNLLKIAVFSENQQLFCFLDNALALETSCIQLGDYNQEWATFCCASNQTDRFWVYDQINSELSLLSTKSSQRQIVQNVREIAGIGTIAYMTEELNFLYLLDENHKLAQFDVYGTLVNTYQFDEKATLCLTDTGIFSLQDGSIYSEYDAQLGVLTNHELLSKLPEGLTEEILEFQVAGNHCYFATQKAIYCYQID